MDVNKAHGLEGFLVISQTLLGDYQGENGGNRPTLFFFLLGVTKIIESNVYNSNIQVRQARLLERLLSD